MNVILRGPALRLVVFSLTVVAPLSSNVSAETIGLFFESDCSMCSTTLAPGTETTLYIDAVREGPFSDYPLSAAEFRVIGLPIGWMATSAPSPEAVFAIGDPFGGGTNIAFKNPQRGRCVRLFTCRITAASYVDNVYLTVVMHTTPNPYPLPGGPCPLIICETGRGEPIECLSCVPKFQAIINGQECSVAVEPNHWSAVKKLYR